MNVYNVGRSDRMRLRTKTSIQYFVKALKSHNLPYSQLSNNLIRELPVGSFLSSQTSTTDIVLSNNLITTLEAGVLDPLSSLQTMYVLHKKFVTYSYQFRYCWCCAIYNLLETSLSAFIHISL